ncbi:MAG: hypothetical protein R3D84_11470 [Paracoccaceae bacterium]
MNVSRSFLLVGVVYLVIGIGFGMHMGASGDHGFMPLHAHINLLGFVLMTLFGILYRIIPAMAAANLARIHFWLHQVGAAILVMMLFLLFSGQVSEAAMFPIAPLAELLVLLATLVFAVNLWRNA